MLKVIRNAVDLTQVQISACIKNANVRVKQTIRVVPESLRTTKPFIRAFTRFSSKSPTDFMVYGVLRTIYNSNGELIASAGDVIYGLRSDFELMLTHTQFSNCLRTVTPSYNLTDKGIDFRSLPCVDLGGVVNLDAFPPAQDIPVRIKESSVVAEVPKYVEREYTSEDISYAVHKGISIKIQNGTAYIGSVRFTNLNKAKQAIDQAEYITSLR